MRIYTLKLYKKITRMLEMAKTPKEIASRLCISQSLVYTAKFRMSRICVTSSVKTDDGNDVN
jgi:hypothetical protein